MSTPPIAKNPLVISKAFRDSLTARTAINNFDTDSKIATITSVLTNELTTLRGDVVKAFQALDYGSAQGADLDKLGAQNKMPRLNSTRANVTKYERNLAFYVAAGTFGDINSTQSITIPKGTIVYSAQSANDLGEKVQYSLTEDLVLAAGDNIGYASAEATIIGTLGNVGAGALRSHNFIAYTLSASQLLKVVNFYPIINGSDTEKDSQYRFRLIKRFEAVQSSNKAAIDLNALSIPGLRNTVILPNYYGVGTVGVVALGVEKQTSPRLINQLQQKLNEIELPGTKYFAMAPITLALDFELNIVANRVLSDIEQQTIETDLFNLFNTLFRQISLGTSVSIKTLQNQVLQYLGSKKITVKDTNVFKKVFKSRSYGFVPQMTRDEVVGDVITLDPIELPILGTLTVSVST